ncbi:sodium:solute symporter family transporter [Methylobacterium sp. J-070]|uniref:sodium:solute symporter family transporter n=1 Tax=Methylobacterium sp. J-070 TaxID=2836650 RepID=UPI001FBAFBCC|nr:sodium/solute symporter [Methylobacterium sp. J-070]MCJ2048941.1 sodium/solute symporter [Methylobacterium sp. J-070]
MARLALPVLGAVPLSVASAADAWAAAGAPQQGHGVTLTFFSVFLVLTLGICVLAARRSDGVDEFLAAGSSITARQNGLATAGDYMSAGAFLGLTGAIYVSGLDGMFLAASYLASWPIVLFVMAEPLRRLGKYSIADVLTHTLDERPARILAAVCALVVTSFYLVAQMVGAGELMALLFGVAYRPAVISTGLVMIGFAALGGMRAATWVQIVKAILMIVGAAIISGGAMRAFGFDTAALLAAAERSHPRGGDIVNTYGFSKDIFATISLGAGILFGTAGLPHILMRFFTVRDERAARVSVFYATCLIAIFFLLILPIGYGSIALLRGDPTFANADGNLRGGNNMAPIHLAAVVGGDWLVGFISAVAFATILAVVSGLLIAGASSMTNDLLVGLRGRPLGPKARLKASRLAAVGLGCLGIGMAILFEGQNVAYMIALATTIAGSANFPLLVLAIYWRGLTTAGAVAGGGVGLVSSVVLTGLGPTVWTKVLNMGPPLFPYDAPALITMPLAFGTCWIVSLVSRRTQAAPAVIG